MPASYAPSSFTSLYLNPVITAGGNWTVPRPLRQECGNNLMLEGLKQPLKEGQKVGDVITDEMGNKQTIRRATMQEVEANTKQRYYKNYLMNTLENVTRLSRIDRNLDFIADTKKELVEQAKEWGQIRWDTAANAQVATKHTGELLQLIVATREYQFA